MSSEQRHNEGDIEIGQLLTALVKKWYLFLLFAVIGIYAGMHIADLQKLRHTVQSIVLIEDNSERTVVAESAVPALNLKYRTKDLESEIAILSSKDLMEKAVLETNAHITVFTDEKFESEVFHSNLPIQINASPPLGNIHENLAITFETVDSLRYKLSYNQGDNPVSITPEYGASYSFIGSEISISKDPNHSNWHNSNEYRCIFFLNKFESIVSQLRNKLEVMEANKNTDGILLLMEETLPERGLAIQHALISNYLIDMEKQRKQMAEDAFHFIEGRLQVNFGDLDSLEAMIAGYKQSNSIALPNKQIEFLYEGIKEFKIELSDAQTQLDVLDRVIIALDKEDHDISIPNTVLGVKDPSLNNLILRLNELHTKREHMKETVHPNNPLFKQLENQIAELKTSMRRDIDNFRENMTVFVKDIEGRITAYEEEIATIGGNNRVLDGMERRRGIMEELYNYLLKRREEAAMVAAANLIDSWVIERPHIHNSFHEPKKSLVILFSALTALMIPLGFVGYKVVFNGRITSLKELKSNTSVPVLGSISKKKKGLRIKRKSNFAANFQPEDFKALYFNLRFSEEQHQTVLFTSLQENEGKTHCALNYAFTLAALGRKTCLVELDLRNPSFCDRLGLTDNIGILNVLDGSADIQEVTKHTAFSEDLKLITSGFSAVDPLKLLMSKPFEAFINTLSKNYEHIILDAPPSIASADILVLAQHADLNLFVVRQNHTPKKELASLEELYQSERVKNMNILYNGVSEKGKNNYYGKAS